LSVVVVFEMMNLSFKMFYILGLNMNEGVEDDLILFGDLFFFLC